MIERALNLFARLWRYLGLPQKLIPRAREGDGAMELYLERFHLFKTPWFAVFLHCFHQSDAEGLHDHPWAFVTIPLTHGYYEDTIAGMHDRRPFRPRFAGSEVFHRVVLKPGTEGRVWTLFIRGPYTKRWGFLGHGVEETYELYRRED